MRKPFHGFTFKRIWLLPLLLMVLLAGHGGILYYLSSHVALSAAVFSGAIILLAIKHLGLLGPLYAWFRQRRSRQKP